MAKEKKLLWRKSKKSLFETFAVELMESTKTKCCPNCGNPYEIGDDDWVVTHIERR